MHPASWPVGFVVQASLALEALGSDLQRIMNMHDGVAFQSRSDPDFVETLALRSVEGTSDFGAAVRSLIARAKKESGHAKLKMLERPNAREIIVGYLADTAANKVIYKAERLSSTASNGGLLSVSYAAEFESDNISDEQEAKVKVSAINALASFDINVAQKTLRAKHWSLDAAVAAENSQRPSIDNAPGGLISTVVPGSLRCEDRSFSAALKRPFGRPVQPHIGVIASRLKNDSNARSRACARMHSHSSKRFARAADQAA